MLGAAHRMRAAGDFRLALRGERAGTKHLVVYVAASPAPGDPSGPPAPPALVGFAVSRQVGSAVMRNRVKRRLRHLLGVRVASLPAGSRVVVRALPAAAAASSDELARSLDRALARVGVTAGSLS